MRSLAAVLVLAACGGSEGATLRPPPPCAAPEVARRPFAHRSSGRGAPHHAVNDVVVAIGEAARVRAKLSYGPLLADLEEEEVTLVGGEGQCGPWQPLATAATDDDGWVAFELPAVPHAAVRPFHAIVVGDGTRASGAVYVVEPGTPAVLFDIDGTLTTGDSQLLADLLGADAPALRPGAADVARAWAARGHLVVYMTGRPYLLRASTLRWLADHGFPPGPVLTVEEHRDALPTAGGVGAFKLAHVRALVAAGLVFDAAYGNAATDVCAYADGGIPPDRTWITELREPCAGHSAPNSLPSYLDHLQGITNESMQNTGSVAGKK